MTISEARSRGGKGEQVAVTKFTQDRTDVARKIGQKVDGKGEKKESTKMVGKKSLGGGGADKKKRGLRSTGKKATLSAQENWRTGVVGGKGASKKTNNKGGGI